MQEYNLYKKTHYCMNMCMNVCGLHLCTSVSGGITKKLSGGGRSSAKARARPVASASASNKSRKLIVIHYKLSAQ